MIIDIISYTDEQYANLTATQLQEIREAQSQKNYLERQLRDRIQKEKDKLIKNGIFNSKLFEQTQLALETDYNADVNLVREGLLFYLRYSMRPEGTVEGDAPYTINYALSEEERLLIVKNYYETTYADGRELFAAFLQDKIAPLYLGELYPPLYDHFKVGAGI